MTETSRVAKVAADELPQDLVELTAALERLPAEYRVDIQPILNRVVESTRRRRRILHLVQDALGQLRLDMKYLLFDLEATRRERDEYRRMSEQ
ncbi:MAG: transcriptional regulator [Pirellulales bacterium]